MLVPNQVAKVKWSNSNKKWYETKGYIFTKMNDEFEVKVEDLSIDSEIRVQISCDKCENIYTLVYRNYVNKNKPHICEECIKKEIKERNTTLCSYCEKKLLIKKYVYNELGSGKRSSVFCDRTCQAKWMSENNKGENNPSYQRFEKICEICSKKYHVPPNRKNKSRFCSKECQISFLTRKKNERIQFKCDYCSKKCETTPSRYKKSKNHFCSHKCADSFRSKKAEIIRKCECCGIDFIIPNKSRKNQRFCSMECQSKWQSEFLVGENAVRYNRNISKSERIINCFWCGKDVEVRPYELKQIKEGSKHKFCSKKCKKEWYAKIWSQSEEWKEKSRKRAVKILTEGNIEKVNTSCQLIVNGILNELKINYINEYDCEYVTIDNYLSGYNLMIEVMGTYWHVDPRIYEKIHYQVQYDRVVNDKRKKALIKSRYGIDILYLWEEDILINPELCKKLILEYINNNGILIDYHSFNYSLVNDELMYENKYTTFMDYEAEKLQDLFEIKSGEKRNFKQENKWIRFNCEHCGKETEQLKSRYKKSLHHFCGKKCAYDFRRGKTLEEIRKSK